MDFIKENGNIAILSRFLMHFYVSSGLEKMNLLNKIHYRKGNERKEGIYSLILIGHILCVPRITNQKYFKCWRRKLIYKHHIYAWTQKITLGFWIAK